MKKETAEAFLKPAKSINVRYRYYQKKKKIYGIRINPSRQKKATSKANKNINKHVSNLAKGYLVKFEKHNRM